MKWDVFILHSKYNNEKKIMLKIQQPENNRKNVQCVVYIFILFKTI